VSVCCRSWWKAPADKQTLILAGEAIPPRVGVGRTVLTRAETGLQLQSVSVLLVRGPPAVTAPVVPAQFLVPYSSSNRFSAAGAAEYARTQNLSAGSTRSRIIDTYA
jgi:hypothetical protein